MNILVITNLYPPLYLGGYELGCKHMVDGLVGNGHEVVVLTSSSHVRDDVNAWTDANGKSPRERVLRRLQLRGFEPVTSKNESVRQALHFEAMVSNYANTSTVLHVLGEHLPDCVYLFNLVGLGGLAIIDVLNSRSIPWMMHLMDRTPEVMQSGVDQSVLSVFHADGGEIYAKGHLIAMTRHLVDEIELLAGFKFRTDVRLIPGWAKTEKSIFQRPYLNSGVVRFVTAGAMLPHKGIGIILDAAALLKAKGVRNFSVELYGDGELGYYIDLSKQLNVSELVTFCGPRTQDELTQIYKSSDAFLFPTWEREPFGFAPVEAAAVGCIPIVTATSGVAERLIDNVNCLKIERSAVALSSVMEKFCAGEVDRQLIGLNAQAITREDLSFDRCLEQVEDSLVHSMKMALQATSSPTWKDFNLAYLKHNLALRMFLECNP